MNAAVVVAGVAAGAGVGLASGALAVLLERVERLEDEEQEERAEHERERAAAALAARRQRRPAPQAPPWRGERYGWTWLERWLSPALAAAGFGLFCAHESGWRSLVIDLVWVAVLVHVVAFDVKHRLILDRVTYPAIAAALALSPVTPGLTPLRALLGGALVFAFFVVQSLVLGGSVLGMGDAKLGAFVGAVCGISFDGHLAGVYAVIAAILLGGAAAVLLLATRLRGLRDPIPYGPYLCAGAALILYLGPGQV